jgi:hypothetical protein
LRTVALLLLAVLAAALPVAAAPVKARSLSGIGVLLLRSDTAGKQSRLALYREPGIGRFAELDAARLPPVFPVIRAGEGIKAVIVTAKKLDWYRIVYDGGEREGWLQGQPSFRYQRWGELLPGSAVSFTGGLRKEYYLLRSEPVPAAEPLETISREHVLPVQGVAGDWLRVNRGAGSGGWLRWRDDNGRLLITVDCRGKDDAN